MLEKKSIQTFIDELKDSTPIPGGGAVAALNGVLSAALIIMVSGVTLKSLEKKKINTSEEEAQNKESMDKLKNVISDAEDIKVKLLKGMQDDVNAYEKVMNAYRLPKNTDEEKTMRSKAILEALKTATMVPLQNAKTAVRLSRLCDIMFILGKKSASSDISVSKLNADASIKGSLANVEININDISDEMFKNEVSNDMNEIIEISQKA